MALKNWLCVDGRGEGTKRLASFYWAALVRVHQEARIHIGGSSSLEKI